MEYALHRILWQVVRCVTVRFVEITPGLLLSPIYICDYRVYPKYQHSSNTVLCIDWGRSPEAKVISNWIQTCQNSEILLATGKQLKHIMWGRYVIEIEIDCYLEHSPLRSPRWLRGMYRNELRMQDAYDAMVPCFLQNSSSYTREYSNNCDKLHKLFVPAMRLKRKYLQ